VNHQPGAVRQNKDKGAVGAGFNPALFVLPEESLLISPFQGEKLVGDWLNVGVRHASPALVLIVIPAKAGIQRFFPSLEKRDEREILIA
jgi:hypothetical protein